MPDLPTGTITFLLTDIEGSTRLWEQHPDGMRQACARHDAIVEARVGQHGGTLVRPRGEGDSRFAVFAQASGALAAASDLQRALHVEPWPSETSLRVRMALHTGDADLRDGDYYGGAVNRCARLRSLAYGGQVLVSLATVELAQDALPEGVSLLELGEHRLKDLGRPERVFQLCHPDLTGGFPPLRSLDALPNNLPRQLTSFIGRDKELAEVKARLGSTCLLTLTGSGGCGKSRLSLQVAADLLEQYPDGVRLVELAPLTDPGLVAPTVAQALAIVPEGNQPVLQALLDYLKPRSLLLILDNCEHLLDECARLVDTLLRSCPNLKVLASSREGLGIAGEFTYRVPSLGVPPADVLASMAGALPPSVETLHATSQTTSQHGTSANAASLRLHSAGAEPAETLQTETLPETLHATSLQTVDERFAQYDAVRLFVERAEAAQPGFRLTDRNAASVVEVCRRLDGIPLCLELAAARVRSLPMEQIGKRMDDVFRLLTGGSRTALPRQQTLRALIDWSYKLLTEQERALLQRLSVFMGGWTLEAAEAVCGSMDVWEYGCDGDPTTTLPHTHTPIQPEDVLDLLSSLVEKSLVNLEETEVGSRYRLLETVWQYAREKLLESGEGEAMRDRHLEHFLAFAEEAEEPCKGPDQVEWLDRLEVDHDNFRATLEWSQAGPDRAEPGLRLAGALFGFWNGRWHYNEGVAWLERLLAQPGAAIAGSARAKALWAEGYLLTDATPTDPALKRSRLEESVSIWRELGDRRGLAQSLCSLGLPVGGPTGRSYLEESRALCREIGDRRGLAGALLFLGILDRDLGDYESARALDEESAALFREAEELGGLGTALSHLGWIARYQGDYTTAQARWQERLAIGQKLKSKADVAFSLKNLGDIAMEQADVERAKEIYAESLALYREMGRHSHDEVHLLAQLGEIARTQGHPEAARQRLHESLVVARSARNPSGMLWCLAEQGDLARDLGDLPQARDLYREIMTLCQEVANVREIPRALAGLAILEQVEGHVERGARLLGAAEAVVSGLEFPLPAYERAELTKQVEAVRSALSAEAFAAAWAEGRAMSLEQAIEYALDHSSA